ncbi:hypothetical protein BH18ACT4_BH18ACT4_03130 [soil metagenome]
MAEGRFVLRYRGPGRRPDSDVERVRRLSDAVIVNSSERMLLVESEEQPLRTLVESMHDWVMAPDRVFRVPDTRRLVDRPSQPGDLPQ